jgi:hypothetical protein
MSFPKTKLFVFGLLGVFLLIAAVGFLWLSSSSNISYDNWGRIDKGMTKREVITILGKANTSQFKAMAGTTKANEEVWTTSDDYGPMIVVEFDQEDKVSNKIWFPGDNNPRPNVLERALKLIGW